MTLNPSGASLSEPKDTNPKTAFGLQKPSFDTIPAPSLIVLGKVMRLGASKYGPLNWRKDAVTASTYLNAAMRHLLQWFSGEEIDPESGQSHLGHVMACCAIVLDAEAHGMLVDDRPITEVFGRMLREHSTPLPGHVNKAS